MGLFCIFACFDSARRGGGIPHPENRVANEVPIPKFRKIRKKFRFFGDFVRLSKSSESVIDSATYRVGCSGWAAESGILWQGPLCGLFSLFDYDNSVSHPALREE
jgi:hypothetical protein